MPSLQPAVAQHPTTGAGRHPMAEAVPLGPSSIVGLIRSFHFGPPRPPNPLGVGGCDVTTASTRQAKVTGVTYFAADGRTACGPANPARLEPPERRAPTQPGDGLSTPETRHLTRENGTRIDPLRRVGDRVLRSPSTAVRGGISTLRRARVRRSFDPDAGPNSRFFHRCGRHCGCGSSRGGVRAGE